MGAPKQRWTSEEDAALRAGIAKHGVGNWRMILKDPKFSSILRYRSNVDLKDKWRNMNVLFPGCGSREKGRSTTKKNQGTPKNTDHQIANNTIASDVDDEIVEEKPMTSVSSQVWNSSIAKKPRSRLNNIILESVKNLNEPTGSHQTTIANYIEEEYWPPSDFDHILSAKLKDLTTNGKLIQVNRKYRIAPDSLYSEERSPKMLLLEDVQRESHGLERDDSKTLTISRVDAELARMATMNAEEAAYTAACAVAEAEALMAEAEAAAREAEAAEADAQAAQAFAEASSMTIKNRNIMELMAQS
ncbi:hypothetical protein QYE76_063530 [Lolium multiflorum]|uniref:MYB transcription factor n=1 Tax=Lolium multiflorum TaxID=4521 RepID=A0AAD8W892_LOLMU|nr:hypothetical protein QYE76_063530 [Lolium multiflorum]